MLSEAKWTCRAGLTFSPFRTGCPGRASLVLSEMVQQEKSVMSGGRPAKPFPNRSGSFEQVSCMHVQDVAKSHCCSVLRCQHLRGSMVCIPPACQGMVWRHSSKQLPPVLFQPASAPTLLTSEARCKNYKIQRRLLHLLSQAAEINVRDSTVTELPPPCAEDELHPAAKQLGSMCAVLWVL